jgi:hypothetical protein
MGDWKKRIQDIMQEMEEIGGPELDEYIEIMGDIATDAEQRVQNAMKLREEIQGILPKPLTDKEMQKAKESYEEGVEDELIEVASKSGLVKDCCEANGTPCEDIEPIPFPLGYPDMNTTDPIDELIDDKEDSDGSN